MVDNLYQSNGPEAGAPVSRGGEITPSDTVNLPRVCRAILVGTSGDVAVVLADDTVLTLPLQAGWNPIRVKRVNATNTTATDLFWFD